MQNLVRKFSWLLKYITQVLVLKIKSASTVSKIKSGLCPNPGFKKSEFASF